MRDIKFRQRDNDGNWHYWGYIDGSFIGPMSKNHASEKSYQYTGLKDKNGVEIYEGDIVKYYDSNFRVYYDPCVISFQIGLSGHCWDQEIADYDEFEVIGNIYENPELLES